MHIKISVIDLALNWTCTLFEWSVVSPLFRGLALRIFINYCLIGHCLQVTLTNSNWVRGRYSTLLRSGRTLFRSSRIRYELRPFDFGWGPQLEDLGIVLYVELWKTIWLFYLMWHCLWYAVYFVCWGLNLVTPNSGWLAGTNVCLICNLGSTGSLFGIQKIDHWKDSINSNNYFYELLTDHPVFWRVIFTSKRPRG